MALPSLLTVLLCWGAPATLEILKSHSNARDASGCCSPASHSPHCSMRMPRVCGRQAKQQLAAKTCSRDKGGFGLEWERTFMARARLMVLLCPFMKWEISACFPAVFSEWEAVGKRLWSDEEKRHTANCGNHKKKRALKKYRRMDI